MLKINDYKKLEYVRRCSGVPIQRNYNLVHHSYMTMILFQHFAKLEKIEYDTDVIELISLHDILETVTGDLLNPVKKFSKETEDAWNIIEHQMLEGKERFSRFTDDEFKSKLTHEQHNLFKACDNLELFIFLEDEIRMGNRTKEVRYIFDKVFDVVMKYGVESINRYMCDNLVERVAK